MTDMLIFFILASILIAGLSWFVQLNIKSRARRREHLAAVAAAARENRRGQRRKGIDRRDEIRFEQKIDRRVSDDRRHEAKRWKGIAA